MAIARIQEVFIRATNTITIAPSGSGNFLLVMVLTTSLATVTGVTDNVGNSYTVVPGSIGSSGTSCIAVSWYVNNCTAGATTLTVSGSLGPVFNKIYVIEYSGVNTISPIDNAGGTGSGSGSCVSPTLTATSTADVLVVAGIPGFSNFTSVTSPWSTIEASTSGCLGEYFPGSTGAFSTIFNPTPQQFAATGVALSPAGGSPPMPTPPLSGLVLWLKPETLPLGSLGDLVTSWTDSSGAGNNFTFGTSTLVPAGTTGELPGLKFLAFRNNNDFLGGPTITLSSAHSVFVVSQILDAGFGNRHPFIGTNNSNELIAIGAFSSYVYGSAQAGIGMADGVLSATVSGYIPGIFATTADGTNTTFYTGNLNSVLNTYPVSGANSKTFNAVGADSVVFGGRGAAESNIAEVLIYNRTLSPTEITTVTSYLNSKYYLPPTSITRIQTVNADPGFTNPVTIAATGSGHLIVIGATPTGAGITSITDNVGNTYVQAPGALSTSGSFHTDVWYAKNSIPGATAVTFVGSIFRVSISEYSGADTSAPLASASNLSTFGSPVSPSLTIADPNGLLFVVGSTISSDLSGTSAPWENLRNGGSGTMADFLPGAAGTYNANFIPSTSQGYFSSGAIFVTSGGSSTLTLSLSDSVSLTDSLTPSFDLSQNLSDSVVVSDSTPNSFSAQSDFLAPINIPVVEMLVNQLVPAHVKTYYRILE